MDIIVHTTIVSLCVYIKKKRIRFMEKDYRYYLTCGILSSYSPGFLLIIY